MPVCESRLRYLKRQIDGAFLDTGNLCVFNFRINGYPEEGQELVFSMGDYVIEMTFVQSKHCTLYFLAQHIKKASGVKGFVSIRNVELRGPSIDPTLTVCAIKENANTC